jgi:hypothetical protein
MRAKFGDRPLTTLGKHDDRPGDRAPCPGHAGRLRRAAARQLLLADYVHCWGGVGRTGTVVGCLLREQGFDAAAALAVIERKWRSMAKRDRHPNSPETPGQVAFIERWPGV